MGIFVFRDMEMFGILKEVQYKSVYMFKKRQSIRISYSKHIYAHVSICIFNKNDKMKYVMWQFSF